MKMLDLYYRAFRSFKRQTHDDLNSRKLRKIIVNTNDHEDVFNAIRHECIIETDWIENIEEGLIYVEKAIREDRQFIRTEGEVVPIEKVKRTSKTSVEHLSKHSDLITRAPKKGGNLIPDRLFIVEKLNDYLVYENRFLYLLLRYLRDFLQVRIDEIKDRTMSYQSYMTMNKTMELNQRRLKYQLSYDDIYKNDPMLLDAYKKIPLVDRLETIYAITVSLLATPLMKEVSKAPMIKPPIIKTNVLRMNQNFRAALKLYHFITSFNKKGYAFKEVKRTFNPFPPDFGDEIAEVIQLTSTVSYIVGNDLRKVVERTYEADESAERERQNKKSEEEIERLKKRIHDMHADPTEYMVKLERRNNQLERDRHALTLEQEKNTELLKTIDLKELENVQLNESVDRLQDELLDQGQANEALKQKYFDDMTEAENVHQRELETQEEKHISLIRSIHEEHERDKQVLIQKHSDEQNALKLEHGEHVRALRTQMIELNETIDQLKSDREDMISDHLEATEKADEEASALREEMADLDEKRRYAHGRYMALKAQRGLLTDEDDFTSKEKFKELELEMAAYKKMFKEQWRITKSKIRQKVKQEVYTDSKEETGKKESE